MVVYTWAQNSERFTWLDNNSSISQGERERIQMEPVANRHECRGTGHIAAIRMSKERIDAEIKLMNHGNIRSSSQLKI